MTISKKPSNLGLNDPVLARQTEANLAQAAVIARGKPTVTSAGELILPSTTVSTTSNSFTTTTSANNQTADTVTINRTSGTVYVNSIDQTIQQTVINNPVAGVSSIIAGNNITITSTGTSGTGDVTISAIGDGNANTGNWEFIDNTMYNMAGGEINNGDTTHGATAGLILPNNGNAGAGASLFNTYGNIGIAVANLANSANTSVWAFGVDGNLTLPANTFAVKYANGTAVTIPTVGNIATINLNGSNSNVLYGNGVFAAVAGGANTGNVTFDDINVIGTGNLKLQPDSANANAYLDIFLTAGPDIHIAGNGETVILGTDDFANVAVNVDGNVSIQAGDANGTHTWNFDTTGNLILAGGNSVIQSIANSSSEPLYPNVSTMVFTPDAFLSSQSLVLDPTGPSHIHLRAPGANIDEPDANIFLGGEASSFEVGYYNGNVPNLYIHSNNNTWTFDTAGTLVFPRDTGPNTTDPILNIIGGANPTITSTDASLAGPANLGISALTTTFTGFTGGAIKIYPDDGEISSTANLQIWANSGGNTEYSWTFDTTGNLTLPLGSIVYETNIPDGALSGSAIALKPIGGTTANQQLLIYPTAADGDHIHMTSGNLYATELFLGSDNFYVKLANTGNVIINSNDGNSSNAMWTFDTDGNLTLPTGGNLIISGSIVSSGASPAPTLSGFSSVSALQFTNGNSNVTINANSNTWVFDSTGNLNLPGNAVAIKFANGSAAFGNIATINLNGNTSQVLLGNGAFAAIPSSSIIANGNSNVSIATANGNVTISAVGNTTMTVTGTGANVTGTLTSTGKIGYASGSTVTQTTNRSQGVTINSLAGTIITTSAVMVPNQVDAIVVNNNQVDPATDIVYAQVVSYHNGCYLVTPLPTSLVGNGFYLYLKNIDTFSTANEAVTIRFMVIKAPNA